MSQIFHSPAFAGVVRDAIKFLQETPVHPLPPADRFVGPGVYMLYYLGKMEHYTHIAQLNKTKCTTPIYVGKAVPPGWRTARIAAESTATTLHGRLREHAGSIEQTENLNARDFRCRFMVLNGLESDLISAVEAALIRQFTPLWNCAVDGFGNHTPGAGRFDQARSEWDVLHPGRTWAARCRGESPILSEIVSKIKRLRDRA